jgi:hypothetical protein
MDPIQPNPSYPFQADARIDSVFAHRDGGGRVSALSLVAVYAYDRKRLIAGAARRLPITGRTVPNLEVVRDELRVALEVVEDRLGPFLPYLDKPADLVGRVIRVGGIPMTAKEVRGQVVLHLRGSVAYLLGHEGAFQEETHTPSEAALG